MPGLEVTVIRDVTADATRPRSLSGVDGPCADTVDSSAK